jgi:HAD superfamily hydrolase (TIGR01456 family)
MSQSTRTNHNTQVAQGKESHGISFAFHIDGVLILSSDLLPGATETLQNLQKQKIPFILRTNGGGKTEKDKAKEPTKNLSVPIDEGQVVLSHSPFQDLIAQYQNKNILVIGGVCNEIRVAKAYGFKNVFTASDLFRTEEHVYPFGQLTAHHHNEHGEIDGPHNKSGRVKISAILIWLSSRDMGLDLQIIMELLLSEGGEVGTVSSLNGNPSLPNRGYGQDN